MNLRKDHYHTDPRSQIVTHPGCWIHQTQYHVLWSAAGCQLLYLVVDFECHWFGIAICQISSTFTPYHYKVKLVDFMFWKGSNIPHIHIQLSATDVLVPTTMKNAAKCDTWCELQDLVNHKGFERTLGIRDFPGSMLAWVSVCTLSEQLFICSAGFPRCFVAPE